MNLKPSTPIVIPDKTRTAFQKFLDALHAYYECVLYYKHTCAWVDTCLADRRKILLSTPDNSSCELKSFNGYKKPKYKKHKEITRQKTVMPTHRDVAVEYHLNVNDLYTHQMRRFKIVYRTT